MKRKDIVELFEKAQRGGYALGSFSPRNTPLIGAVINAAKAKNSPVMVQISSNEMRWFELEPKKFVDQFRKDMEGVSVPVILHLDHTYDFETIKKAIEAGFESVMIDGSKLPFEENIALTKQVVEYAHGFDVAVEAELGNIGGTDTLETGGDKSLYTIPEQAAEFVMRSGCDTLAVSVGTAHGVYLTKNPRIDFERLQKIRNLVDIPLVLHGGSGLPMETVRKAICLTNGKGGIAKLNIATDLESIFQSVMQIERIPNRDTIRLDGPLLKQAADKVQAFVENYMTTFLLSDGKAE